MNGSRLALNFFALLVIFRLERCCACPSIKLISPREDLHVLCDETGNEVSFEVVTPNATQLNEDDVQCEYAGEAFAPVNLVRLNSSVFSARLGLECGGANRLKTLCCGFSERVEAAFDSCDNPDSHVELETAFFVIPSVEKLVVDNFDSINFTISVPRFDFHGRPFSRLARYFLESRNLNIKKRSTNRRCEFHFDENLSFDRSVVGTSVLWKFTQYPECMFTAHKGEHLRYRVIVVTFRSKTFRGPWDTLVPSDLVTPGINRGFAVDHRTTHSAKLSWDINSELRAEEVYHHYMISVLSLGRVIKNLTTYENRLDLFGLEPCTTYVVFLATVANPSFFHGPSVRITFDTLTVPPDGAPALVAVEADDLSCQSSRLSNCSVSLLVVDPSSHLCHGVVSSYLFKVGDRDLFVSTSCNGSCLRRFSLEFPDGVFEVSITPGNEAGLANVSANVSLPHFESIVDDKDLHVVERVDGYDVSIVGDQSRQRPVELTVLTCVETPMGCVDVVLFRISPSGKKFVGLNPLPNRKWAFLTDDDKGDIKAPLLFWRKDECVYRQGRRPALKGGSLKILWVFVVNSSAVRLTFERLPCEDRGERVDYLILVRNLKRFFAYNASFAARRRWSTKESLVVSNLSDASCYSFSVRPCNEFGCGEASDDVRECTPTSPNSAWFVIVCFFASLIILVLVYHFFKRRRKYCREMESEFEKESDHRFLENTETREADSGIGASTLSLSATPRILVGSYYLH